MKRAILVVGAVCLSFVAGLFALAYYVVTGQEKEKNYSKTQAARDARWPEKKEPSNEEQKTEIPPTADLTGTGDAH